MESCLACRWPSAGHTSNRPIGGRLSALQADSRAAQTSDRCCSAHAAVQLNSSDSRLLSKLLDQLAHLFNSPERGPTELDRSRESACRDAVPPRRGRDIDQARLSL